MQNSKKARLGQFIKRSAAATVFSAIFAMLTIGFTVNASARQTRYNESSGYAAVGMSASERIGADKTIADGATSKVLLGGMPFGVKLHTQGIVIVGMSDITCGGKTSNPAYDAGIRVKDIILKIDGKDVASASDVVSAIEKSDGKDVKITVKRGNDIKEFTVKPLKSDSDGKYKAGIWTRDGTAGIGTITFILPETGAFGGLGHGINDIDTGELMPMSDGTVYDVTLSGLVKGKSGAPGEIHGYFNPVKIGKLLKNTDSGTFGILSTEMNNVDEPMEVAKSDEVKEGKAKIYCTLDSDGRREYEIEIVKIAKDGSNVKNFTIVVTDPALIEKTGGIIQGMSGSPIVQNGKLIGAVTHVMVNDPRQGYGIFIGNMMKELSGMQ